MLPGRGHGGPGRPGESNLLAGKSEEEFGALAGFRLDPHTAPVALDDLVTNGQTDSAPRIFPASVQTLEETKYLLVVLGIDPDPIVRDANLPHAAIPLRGDMNSGGLLAAVLETVTDKILQKLLDVNLLDAKQRQRVTGT